MLQFYLLAGLSTLQRFSNPSVSVMLRIETARLLYNVCAAVDLLYCLLCVDQPNGCEQICSSKAIVKDLFICGEGLEYLSTLLASEYRTVLFVLF